MTHQPPARTPEEIASHIIELAGVKGGHLRLLSETYLRIWFVEFIQQERAKIQELERQNGIMREKLLEIVNKPVSYSDLWCVTVAEEALSEIKGGDE